MTSENEDIKTDGAQESGENKEDEPKHQSFISKIVEKIEDAIQELDTDFPLSGGEEVPVHHKHHKEAKSDEDKKEEHPKKTSFFHDMDTDFPLSGGEV